jgi:hypothetical protein
MQEIFPAAARVGMNLPLERALDEIGCAISSRRTSMTDVLFDEATQDVFDKDVFNEDVRAQAISVAATFLRTFATNRANSASAARASGATPKTGFGHSGSLVRRATI